MVPPQHERDAARRMHATTTTLASGHVPMLSHPQDVARVILDAANKAGAGLTQSRGAGAEPKR